jgi:hypothetical protein
MRTHDIGDFGSQRRPAGVRLFWPGAGSTGVVGVFAVRRSSSELARRPRAAAPRQQERGDGDRLAAAGRPDGLRARSERPRPRCSRRRRGRALRSDALALGSEGCAEELPGGPLAAPDPAIAAGKSVLRLRGEQRLLLVHAPDPRAQIG